MVEEVPTDHAAIDIAALDEIEPRDEASTRVRALLDDKLWWLLALGVLTTAGGLIGVFLSVSRVRPEVQVYRQLPYLVSAMAFSSVVVLGGLICVLYLLWRVFGSYRALMLELEEAAAAMMWERAFTDADTRGAAVDNGQSTASPTRGTAPRRRATAGN